MLITDEFVLLNFPRTGSTFVREAVKELYGAGLGPLARLRSIGRQRRALRELILPIERTTSAIRVGRRSQHGAFSQIPTPAHGRPVVSVTRNPLHRIVSMYEHGFWRDNPGADPAEVRQRHPDFPNLSFADYLVMMNHFGCRDVLKGSTPNADVGPQTLHFMRFYSRDPDAAIGSLTDEKISTGAFREDLGHVRFLHTENLATELRDFLAEVGIEHEETAFISKRRPSNAAAGQRDRAWPDYYTDRTREFVRHKERLLFEMFPEYDQELESP